MSKTKKIPLDQAKILHQRAVECAGAMINAEIMHENGELEEQFYRSFKNYFATRTRLDFLTAETQVDFELTQSEKEIVTFLAAWQALAPDHLRQALKAETISANLHKGLVLAYAFDFVSYDPVGTILYAAPSVKLPFKTGIYIYVFPSHQAQKSVLQTAAKIIKLTTDQYHAGA